MMKVLLLEDVKNLGKAGEVCEVKDGYGNNFLIANKKPNSPLTKWSTNTKPKLKRNPKKKP